MDYPEIHGFAGTMQDDTNMHLIALIPLHLLFSLLVGLLGRHRKFGFWGYFFGSIVLTPVIGLLMVLASDPRKPGGISK